MSASSGSGRSRGRLALGRSRTRSSASARRSSRGRPPALRRPSASKFISISTAALEPLAPRLGALVLEHLQRARAARRRSGCRRPARGRYGAIAVSHCACVEPAGLGGRERALVEQRERLPDQLLDAVVVVVEPALERRAAPRRRARATPRIAACRIARARARAPRRRARAGELELERRRRRLGQLALPPAANSCSACAVVLERLGVPPAQVADALRGRLPAPEGSRCALELGGVAELGRERRRDHVLQAPRVGPAVGRDEFGGAGGGGPASATVGARCLR